MLMVHLMGEGAEQRRQMLGNFDQPVNADNETKAWAFLETRAQLLLRAYPTTTEVCSYQLDSLVLLTVYGAGFNVTYEA